MKNKILIIKPSGIGDIVHSLPVAIMLKKLVFNCELHWLVFSKFAKILEGINYVDKLILWDRNGGIKEYLRIIKLIRNESYDLVIDLQGLVRTAIINFFSKGKQRVMTSFVRECSNIFIRPIGQFNPELHAVERNYEVIKYLFPKNSVAEPKNFLPWITLKEDVLKWSKTVLSDNKNFVLFSVGSRGKHKIWPQENFAELINMLYAEFNITAVFVGSEQEKELVENIIKKISCEYKNFVGETDLIQTCGIISRCNLVISNDNGIAHIAAAMDKPTIIIFGPTNPKWFYPYNDKSGYIFKNYSCSPCGIKTSCKDNKCMKDVTPQEVFEYIKTNFYTYISI